MRTRLLAGLCGLAAMGALLVAAPPAGHAGVPASSRLELAVRAPLAAGADEARGRRFWVKDKHRYRSKWYAGKHRKMINFGCTRAPYYDPSPLCTRNRGFHHGLDIAMKCRTRLYAGLSGRVVQPDSAGSLGSAYGPWAFRIRNHRLDRDFVIGHVRRVYVSPGDRVSKGDLIARASDAGAPDGCHLHFEARPVAGSYTTAVKPHPFLRLRQASAR